MSPKKKLELNTNKKILLRFVALIVLGILVQIGATYLLNGIMESFAPLANTNEEYNQLIDNLTQNDLRIMVHVMLIAPLLEEAVFRFAFIGLGLKIWNDKREEPSTIKRFWILNVISSLLFGIYHGNIVQGIYGFLLGMMLGYIYFYLGKYLASLVVHMVINTSGLYLTGYLPSSMKPGMMIVIGSIVMLICIALLKCVQKYSQEY